MKKALALAALLLASGCASTYYAKNGAGPDSAEAKQDLKECSYQAEMATVNLRSGVEAGWRQSELTRKCMDIKGYTLYRSESS